MPELSFLQIALFCLQLMFVVIFYSLVARGFFNNDHPRDCSQLRPPQSTWEDEVDEHEDYELQVQTCKLLGIPENLIPSIDAIGNLIGIALHDARNLEPDAVINFPVFTLEGRVSSRGVMNLFWINGVDLLTGSAGNEIGIDYRPSDNATDVKISFNKTAARGLVDEVSETQEPTEKEKRFFKCLFDFRKAREINGKKFDPRE